MITNFMKRISESQVKDVFSPFIFSNNIMIQVNNSMHLREKKI